MAKNNLKIILPAAAAWAAQALYTVSPIDLIPDIIPILGLADDFFGLVLVVAFTGFTLYRLHKRENLPAPQPQAAKQPQVVKTFPGSSHPIPDKPVEMFGITEPSEKSDQDRGYFPLSMEEIRQL